VTLRLLIGNKRYSSWSLRPWIAMKVLGIPFTETLLPLYLPGSREEVLKYSPTGKVPVLIDGEISVWESLAILDYLAGRFPDKKMWPDDRAARALARSVAAEMHAGFQPLRRYYPMNLARDRTRPRVLEPEAEADVQASIARVDGIWSEARKRYGKDGPFLFGAFGAADAMFAPVVSRLFSYSARVGDISQKYIETMMALPAWQEWEAAGRQETWIMDGNEV
jgi:glutathione S-transferase